MRIGSYECLTPFATVGSGSARWCVVQKGGTRYFLKQFLTPVQPAQSAPVKLKAMQQNRCDVFERRKRALYAALRCVLGDCVVPVTDFFPFEGRYFAVSEYIAESQETFDTLGAVAPKQARQLLFALARCLGRLHAQGVVHADLKPEHVLLQREGETLRVRLIDFDSGFLEDDPPIEPRDMEGDPVYLAPEAYLRMRGEEAALSRKLDTFAFGAIAHQVFTGSLPDPGQGQTYLYQTALAGEPIRLSGSLPVAYRWLISKAFSADPDARPTDGMLERLFSPPQVEGKNEGSPVNGLSRFLR